MFQIFPSTNEQNLGHFTPDPFGARSSFTPDEAMTLLNHAHTFSPQILVFASSATPSASATATAWACVNARADPCLRRHGLILGVVAVLAEIFVLVFIDGGLIVGYGFAVHLRDGRARPAASFHPWHAPARSAEARLLQMNHRLWSVSSIQTRSMQKTGKASTKLVVSDNR